MYRVGGGVEVSRPVVYGSSATIHTVVFLQEALRLGTQIIEAKLQQFHYSVLKGTEGIIQH